MNTSPTGRAVLRMMACEASGLTDRESIHPSTRAALISRGLIEWVPLDNGWAGPHWSRHLRLTDRGRREADS